MEFAFFEVGIELVFEKLLEDFSDMADMLFEGIGIYQDVVKECDTEDIEEFVENVVDVGLEGGWCVCKPKRHNKVFEVTKTCTKCCFKFVAHCDTDKVVRGYEIDLGEASGSSEAIQEFSDKG